VGRMIGTGIPVFEGLERPVLEDLVALGAALASSGGVALFHALGVTPEAGTLQQAFGSRRYETREITEKNLEIGRQKLTSAEDRKVDYVAVGCPHCSLNQLRELAGLLQGRKVQESVTFWVHTNGAVKAMGRQLGFVQEIEQAGAVVTQDLCTILSAPEALGFGTLATNSAKMAFYAPGSNGFKVWFGSTAQCVQAALQGLWSG
jgi:predicted aconitase